MKKLKMKKCHVALIQPQQKYQNYHRLKLINVNIKLVRKFLPPDQKRK